MPGFVAVKPHFAPPSVGLKYVDHCVGNVELGKMNHWVEFYAHVMGFRNLLTFDDKTISTEYSSLMSKVMANGNDRIKFPINEPARGKRKSQIDEYLEFYKGPGVQHMALATDDIIKTVTTLRDRGVEFLSVPTAYYDELQTRIGKIDEPVDTLAAILTGTCYRSSRSQWRIGRRCSTRSSNERAPRASAPATSRRSSKRSSASRGCGGTCRGSVPRAKRV
jgi:4-hydroxyphenylpyruvate dioxygenase